MSTLFVDTINEKTTGNGIVIPGHVVQVQYRRIATNVFTTTSSSMVDWTGAYVDITPKSSNNILIWQAALMFNSNSTGNYGRFRIVDALNSDTQWSENSYIAGPGYYAGTSEQVEFPILHANTAGTTNAMRLQLQGFATGGTIRDNWSGADDRTIMVMEIAQ